MMRFFGSAEVGPEIAGSDAGSIAEAVIQHLELMSRAGIKVTGTRERFQETARPPQDVLVGATDCTSARPGEDGCGPSAVGRA
jgi:hypothetical protein